MDAANGKATNGTNIRMHTANGSPAQCFYLEEVKPFGGFDAAKANQLTGEVAISGWAADWSAPKAALQIQIHVDGKLVRTATANGNRDDVVKVSADLGAAHGYDVKLTVEPGTHKIEIYAINIDAAGKKVGTGNTLLGSKTITVEQKAE